MSHYVWWGCFRVSFSTGMYVHEHPMQKWQYEWKIMISFFVQSLPKTIFCHHRCLKSFSLSVKVDRGVRAELHPVTIRLHVNLVLWSVICKAASKFSSSTRDCKKIVLPKSRPFLLTSHYIRIFTKQKLEMYLSYDKILSNWFC